MIGNWNYGTGRRKSSVARVFMKKGTGQITRQRQAGRGVLRPPDLDHGRAPAAAADGQRRRRSTSRSTCTAAARSGQAGAVRHGITRALIDYDAALKPELSRAGFVTRDAREVERKKVGLHGARRRKQFSKR